ncbi:HAD family hydrolase [Candidatus Bipolaricaulota bacterium]|nr:HAD family hydrolase [Candidatus Bipolaricaulota bacterium]
MMEHLETVIWDFNGTLIDDLDLVVRTVNTQLEKRNLSPLTTQDYRDVFGFPVEDYYRRIGVTFEDETMAELSADFFADYAPALKDCPLHDDVRDTLELFKARVSRQFVLSAMEQGMLRSMIRHLGIDPFFDGVYGLAHQEGDSKVSRAHELKQDYGIDPTTSLFIGDTAHDAEVAQALGMSVILISTGHQSAERLRDTGHPVVESYQELQRAVLPHRS